MRRMRAHANLVVLSCIFTASLVSCSPSTLTRRTPADELPHTAECADFRRFLTEESTSENGLKTDGLVVVRGGQTRYEYYDGFYKPDSPHCLWSASKTVAAAIVGTAVQNQRVSLDDRVATYYPATLRDPKDPNGRFYDQVKLSDLLWMGAGFDWRESYDDDIRQSTVLPMLYTAGYKDMATFAARAPMRSEGPGRRWVYSGGNSNLLMGVLKKIYGDQYDTMPWKNLFDIIGMQHVVFEKDGAGVFVGSSYVHATPRDMAKLGLLFLHDGVFEGKRLLPENWMRLSRTVSPAVQQEATPLDYIQQEGVFGMAMWLNQRVRGLDLPFPNSPEDLFLAAGHYGQLILVIPSQDMVIARTGHDKEYWSKIDGIVSRAVRCFR